MPRLHALALLFTLALITNAVLTPAVLTPAVAFSQDKKDPPKERVKESIKAKGRLPNFWGKLGLSDQQRQEIYKIQAKYDDEIIKLKSKLKEMESKQKSEMEKVLTEDQKKKLVEIILGTKDKD